jgi:hypothetical protein
VGYTVVGCTSFLVREGFPRIIERDVPQGVGHVHYTLALDACGDFIIDDADLLHWMRHE